MVTITNSITLEGSEFLGLELVRLSKTLLS